MNAKELVILDIECYPNYVLLAFQKVDTGDVIMFDRINDGKMNIKNIIHLMSKYTIVTFNGIKYDQLIVEAILAGMSNETLHKITNMIIVDGMQPWQVRKQCGFRMMELDHIDLIEVAPLMASLKIYAGRLHARKMQDLPIEPNTSITHDMALDLRSYCKNDTQNTKLLLDELWGDIELREAMSLEYHTDLRSKSDAQIAEAVIKAEFEKHYDSKPKRPKVEEGTEFYFKKPAYMTFQTDEMRAVLKLFEDNPFTVNAAGHIKPSEALKGLKIELGGEKYTLGVGGIHSCEKKTHHVASEDELLEDVDVESYYPNIILKNRLAPRHLGKAFLKIFGAIVKRRLIAKHTGDKGVNATLKIVINGTFGKLASKWSVLYSPDLMMQVTVIGQLSLLMLIERMVLAGIPVVNANTDGIVLKMTPEQKKLAYEIVEDWEFETDYTMESTSYRSLSSRDVNNYIALKPDGEFKCKGAYANGSLRNNPTNQICVEAVKGYLGKETPVSETIRSCTDIRKFVTIRTVNGGAISNGELLGKAIRWYYGVDELDAIHYKTNGNKVPRSDGAIPIMELPDELPGDIDYEWYENEANKMLKEIGLTVK